MNDIVGPATISVGQGFAAFQFFMPKLSEVRKASAANDPDMVGDVRLGEIASFTMCVGIGAIVSSLTGSPIPAYVSLLIAFVLICVYETALQGDRVGNPPSAVRSEVV